MELMENIISIINNESAYEILEAAISPFELQKADEVFLTNSIVGIQPITKYRKTIFNITVAKYLQNKLKERETLT